MEVDVNEEKQSLKSIDFVKGHMVSIMTCQYWNISVNLLCFDALYLKQTSVPLWQNMNPELKA